MLLTILIPTFNRVSHLEKNIHLISTAVANLDAFDQVEVIVSDNASSDATSAVLRKMASELDLAIEVIRQPENIGSVNNVLFLLHKAKSPYMMFLGDDDFIQEGYLSQVLELISQGKVGVVVPSNQAVDIEGILLPYGRDIGVRRNEVEAGFRACLKHSWRGHQMSGLVFKADGLAQACQNADVSNLYLFIYLVGFSALQGGAAHLPEYPVLVTRPPQSHKDWSYGDDGLVSEIFDNYRRMPGINYPQRALLEMKLLYKQYWRYMMYLKLGGSRFAKAIAKIFFGPNTTLLGGSTGLLLTPLFLILNVLALVRSGQLLATLKKPVDI